VAGKPCHKSMEDIWNLYCVDIEIWVKDNPVSTGLRVACQDAYEPELTGFSKNPKWGNKFGWLLAEDRMRGVASLEDL